MLHSIQRGCQREMALYSGVEMGPYKLLLACHGAIVFLNHPVPKEF